MADNTSSNGTSSTGGTLLGSIVGGVFNMANGALSALYNKNQQTRALEAQIASEERQNQYNVEAEKRALQYQKDIIDYTNDYNTPEKQMQRYADAGLNPYLVDVDSGSMSQPAGVGATPVNAESGYQSVPTPDFGLNGFAKGALEGAQYSLEKKRTQLEADKIELARQEFFRGITESDREFLYKKQMDEAELNFKKAVADADEKYRTKQIDLAAKKELREAAHQTFEEARATAADIRAAEKHGLEMRIGNLAYNKSEEEYTEIWPEQKRAKILQAKYDSLLNDLNDEQRELIKSTMTSSLRLKQRVIDNDMSLAEYERELRNLWDKTRDKKFGRFSNTSAFMSNPYEEARGNSTSVVGKISDIALKLLKM